ncbi:MAG: chorismate synthase [Kiritimatiellae bacterium]|nr:chorismate synthase [Kiritimatiellia bacterium]
MEIRIFGESHAPEIGVEIEGVPKGTAIDVAELQAFLDRRAPGNGQGGMSTPRKEPDKVEFESGVVNGVATGAMIRAVIRNTNTRPQDYANVQTVPRPGHADYASWLQCGQIPTGGGKWSGRMTAPLCIAGGIALQMLKRRGVTISSSVTRGRGNDEIPDGDSVGGIVEVVATGFPAGHGDVGTDGLESKLAAAFFGIPAVKGVEFGDGFGLADQLGSLANDAFAISESGEPVKRVVLKTNHCGGILGGVSVGMPIVARLAFKPTPSIALEQDSVDLKTLTPAKITVKGRHDRCVAFRGAVAAEAAMSIVLATELFG